MRPDLTPLTGFDKGSLPFGSKKDWLTELLADLDHPRSPVSKEGAFGGGRTPGEDVIDAAGAAPSQEGCLWPRQGSSASSGFFVPSPASFRRDAFSGAIAEFVSVHKLQLADLAVLRATAENSMLLRGSGQEPQLLDIYRGVRRVISNYKKIPEGSITYGQYLELDLNFERWEKRWLKPYLDEEFLEERIRIDADELERTATVGTLVQSIISKLI